MPETLAQALSAARTALLTVGPPVLLPGQADPETPEVIVLAAVSDTALSGYGTRPTVKRVQVSAYAATYTRALEISEAARTALGAAGFPYLASRPTPDAVGHLSEYRR